MRGKGVFTVGNITLMKQTIDRNDNTMEDKKEIDFILILSDGLVMLEMANIRRTISDADDCSG